ncbi:MAG: 50S ribosome-binding GTPase, partial [Desulfobacterales bacterium]|nr:50S ribosome-binding GTPase [Desulfobacterales bacterium]
MDFNDTMLQALRDLRTDLPEMLATLKMGPTPELEAWTHALDVKLLPKLAADFPLVVAIGGGGSAGKSTLFNTLVGRALSPTGGRAGLNRRVLAGLPEAQARHKALFESLAQIFGAALQPLKESAQLTTPGDPLYCTFAGGPARVVLLDTPDIDTGARGDYANRELARQSLQSADAFIYIFTNANYNNRDNTDFIARLLTGLGKRPCCLVYRVYPSFTDAEVREHALTVAANLYGAEHTRHVLGLFRADDDNRVAAGQAPMQIRPIGGGPNLPDLLAALDPQPMRRQLLGSMLLDAARQAAVLYEKARQDRVRLANYTSALEVAQRASVQQALRRFPTDRVLRRFADIWLAGDPAHIKVMRRTGQVVEWPLKIVLSAARRLRSFQEPNSSQVKNDDPAGPMAMDLLDAATALYQHTVDAQIQGPDGLQPAHPVVHAAQQRARQKDWRATLTHIQEQKTLLLSWSDQLERDLAALADILRQRMGVLDQLRQTFAALLNVIPATAAITYILHTGDPAGAVGIKIKLTGLLGLHDLYALIAIPATAGMKKADQRQLEQMLAPVAQTWLAHKLTAVQRLFEEQITGEVLTQAHAAGDRADALLAWVQADLTALKEILP